MGHLIAKLVVVNLVKFHLNKFNHLPRLQSIYVTRGHIFLKFEARVQI